MTTLATNYVVALFMFLTLWTWLALMFHRRLYRHIDLLFLGFVVMFIGIYLGHVNPRYFIVSPDNSHNNDIIFDDKLSLMTADIIHIIPFLIFAAMYGRYYARQPYNTLFIRTFCIISTYLILFSPSRVYRVNTIELLMLGSVTTVLYLLLLLVLAR